MSHISLKVAPATISLRGGGPATGNIEVIIGNKAFPVEGWNDFVIVVLTAWCAAIVQVLTGMTDSERVHFMEGPYSVVLAKVHGGLVQVRAVERRHVDELSAAVEVPPGVLAENVVAAAQSVVEACHARGHQSRDLSSLRGALELLRKELRTLTPRAQPASQ